MIADIRLQNYRSYEDKKFSFDPNINIISGPNASGKTNLLEAILMVSKGKSYRAKDNELIQFNKNWLKITATLDDGTKRVTKIDNVKNFTINDKQYKRLPPDKTLPLVLFEPNHLLLLTGSPDKRRDYLDDLIEQTNPQYAKIRNQYQRTLDQRNRLLKQLNLKNNHLFPWDIKLSQLAGQVILARLKITELINEQISQIYKSLSGDNKNLKLKYLNSWPAETYETNLLKSLETNLIIDNQKGYTSVGPHREDFETTLNNKNSIKVASRGELRTLVLTLKIIELQIIESVRGQKPLLLLDDVFSELDKQRTNHLLKMLDRNQVFITTTNNNYQINKSKQVRKIKLDNTRTTRA